MFQRAVKYFSPSFFSLDLS